MNIITERISALRQIMKAKNMDALYFSGTDVHASEYLPEYWKTREFITDFTGSFGNIVVTAERAVLWTDSRYFIQAEEQLKNTGIEMQKLRVTSAVLPENWLAVNLQNNAIYVRVI